MDDDDDNNFGASKNGVNAFLVTWKKSRHFNHSITNSIINTIQEIMHPPIKHILKIISWLDPYPWSVSWLTLDKESITFIISPWKYLIVCISIMIYPKKNEDDTSLQIHPCKFLVQLVFKNEDTREACKAMIFLCQCQAANVAELFNEIIIWLKMNVVNRTNLWKNYEHSIFNGEQN